MIPHLTKIAVKHVEWTVVVIVLHVINKVFHLQFNRISSIVLTTLETLIPKPSRQSLSNADDVIYTVHIHKQFFILFIFWGNISEHTPVCFNLFQVEPFAVILIPHATHRFGQEFDAKGPLPTS